MENLSEQEKAVLQKIEEKGQELKDDVKNEIVKTEESYNNRFKEIEDSLKTLQIDPEKIVEIKEQLKSIEENNNHLGEELTKIKQLKAAESQPLHITFWKGLFEDENYKKWVKDGAHRKLPLDYKGVVDITNDYTGTTLISSMRRSVVDTEPDRLTHLRDIMSVFPTTDSVHTFPEEYDWVDAADVAAENATAGESSFLVREATVSAIRIPTYVNVSKRMLKNIEWLTRHLSTKLPKKILRQEDFQILWGDGSGNNMTGIMINCSNFVTEVSTGETFTAGAISSIATWNSGTQTIVNFAAAHGLNDGDILTLANAGGYNGAHNIIWKTYTSIVIDVAYAAGGTGAFTGTSKNPFYQAIEEAQEYDVIAAAIAIQERSNYEANGIVLNKVDATKIELLKDANGQYIQGIQRVNGMLTIMGVPVVENDAISAGRFLVGNWTEAVELLEFTPLSVTIRDDVTYALANQVAVIAEEEVLLPIYNAKNFIQGTFTTAITAIGV